MYLFIFLKKLDIKKLFFLFTLIRKKILLHLNSAFFLSTFHNCSYLILSIHKIFMMFLNDYIKIKVKNISFNNLKYMF